MTILVRPFGQTCKSTPCTYCFQKGVRKYPSPELDLEELKKRIKEAVENSPNETFNLHGGDVGEFPEEVRRELINWGYREFGTVGVQTGGWWLDKETVDWLAEREVKLGLSMDGPWPLNERRLLESREKTREYTERLMELIPYMKKNLRSIGVIATLHGSNLVPDSRFERFKKWWKWLDSQRVGGYLHVLKKVDGESVPDYIYKGALLDLAREYENFETEWNPFKPIKETMGLKKGESICTWNNCDPFYTQAVDALDRDGVSTCSRNFEEGLRYLKADTRRETIRTEILRNTPQEEGGCKDCYWWEACQGGCPSTGISNDWRNRTIHCDVYKTLFCYYKGRYNGREK